jgi:hypothetical protein
LITKPVLIAVEKPLLGEDGIRILGDVEEASDAIAVDKLSVGVGHWKDYVYVQFFLLLSGEVETARIRGADAWLLH